MKIKEYQIEKKSQTKKQKSVTYFFKLQGPIKKMYFLNEMIIKYMYLFPNLYLNMHTIYKSLNKTT